MAPWIAELENRDRELTHIEQREARRNRERENREYLRAKELVTPKPSTSNTTDRKHTWVPKTKSIQRIARPQPNPFTDLRRRNDEGENWDMPAPVHTEIRKKSTVQHVSEPTKQPIKLFMAPKPIAEKYQPTIAGLIEQEMEIRRKREALENGIRLAEATAESRRHEIDEWEEMPAGNIYPQTTCQLANTTRPVSTATHTIISVPVKEPVASTSGTQVIQEEICLSDDDEPQTDVTTLTTDTEASKVTKQNVTEDTRSESVQSSTSEITIVEQPMKHIVYEPTNTGDEDLPVTYKWPTGVENIVRPATLRRLQDTGMQRYRKYEFTRNSKNDSTANVQFLGIIEMPVGLMRRHNADAGYDYSKLDKDEKAKRQVGKIIDQLWSDQSSNDTDRQLNIMIDAHKLTTKSTANKTVEIEVHPVEEQGKLSQANRQHKSRTIKRKSSRRDHKESKHHKSKRHKK